MNIKKKAALGIVSALAVVGLTACGGGGAVVKTDDGDVTKDELYDAMKDKYGSQTVQQLTFEKVLEKKYKVTDKAVNAKVKTYKDQYGDQFASVLAQSGLTEDSFKENIKYNLLVEKATEDNVKVTDKKLKAYYKTWKPDITVRHILVEKEDTAKEVEKKLKDGAKFEDLAKEYSTDTSTKNNGGLLPAFGPGKMDAAFEKAAYALKKKGDISAPVKSQYGYHVIEMVKPADKTSFEKDKKAVKKAYIASQVTQENMQKALKKVYKDAGIKVEDKDLKDAFSQYSSSKSSSSSK